MLYEQTGPSSTANIPPGGIFPMGLLLGSFEGGAGRFLRRRADLPDQPAGGLAGRCPAGLQGRPALDLRPPFFDHHVVRSPDSQPAKLRLKPTRTRGAPSL